MYARTSCLRVYVRHVALDNYVTLNAHVRGAGTNIPFNTHISASSSVASGLCARGIERSMREDAKNVYYNGEKHIRRAKVTGDEAGRGSSQVSPRLLPLRPLIP